MDLSYIYGSDNDTAATVRAYSEGRLASVFRKGKEVLPQDSEPKFACNVNDDMEPCYMAGKNYTTIIYWYLKSYIT